jgi:type IV pilus assembly protein PilQ
MKLIPLLLLLGLSLTLQFAESETATSPTISMDFQDADLKDVLKVFSQQAGLNFIASEHVKQRKVTLYLDSVSVGDALNTILSANNLTYEQEKESRIFVVKEWGRPDVETITKVFPLQYARVTGSELTQSGIGLRGGGTDAGIKEVIKELLTEYGRIIEDARTNSLIVTDLPTQFTKIEQTIKQLDIKLPQVMIEAEVIEASLDTIDKLGIDWGNLTTGALLSAKGAARPDSFPWTKNPSIAGPDGNPTSLYTGYISAMELGGTLAMLTKDTDTKILARPKILTLNNETAEIRITSDTAVSSATTQIGTEGGLGTSTTTIERFETGVSLLVTPQINKSGEITMFIEPSVVTVKSSALLSNVSDPQTRSAKTTVTINDGDTVIIGGLIDTEDEKIFRKVPFLGDIPVLGNIFTKRDDSTQDRELIIFITPHLVSTEKETAGLPERELPWSDEDLAIKKEEAMEEVLDKFEH